MAGLLILVRDCMDNIKSILTTNDFGSEYEVLCSQLAIQHLRLSLWIESVGGEAEIDTPSKGGILDRSDVHSNIVRTIDSISLLVMEIKAVKQKYELKPRLELINESPGEKAVARHSKGGFLDATLPRRMSLLHRARSNQRQKSLLSVAKWATRDSKKFDEKVNKIKLLVDGLEDIIRAVKLTQSLPAPDLTPTTIATPDENPPPYSLNVSPDTPPVEIPTIAPVRDVTSTHDLSLLQQFQAMKLFATGSAANPYLPTPRGSEKLARLTTFQLKELRIDVYDDLIRRQEHPPSLLALPPVPSFHPKRNQAREKLSTVPAQQLGRLTADIVFELGRRFPHLEQPSSPSSQVSVLPPNSPPPLLRHRAMHPSLILEVPASRQHNKSNQVLKSNGSSRPLSTYNVPVSSFSTAINPNQRASLSRTNTESTNPTVIFKSFRVHMYDTTADVLPIALKKYNITSSPELFELCIVYGDKERSLGLTELPLPIFKQIHKLGLKPTVMLRRAGSGDSISGDRGLMVAIRPAD